jgi:hypothetical protein
MSKEEEERISQTSTIEERGDEMDTLKQTAKKGNQSNIMIDLRVYANG